MKLCKRRGCVLLLWQKPLRITQADLTGSSQKNGVLELYNQYRLIFRGWNIPNLKNAAK